MKLFCPIIALALFFLSCASLPSEMIEASFTIPETTPEVPAGEIPDIRMPGIKEMPSELPETPMLIMGKGIVPKEKLADFLQLHNTGVDEDFILALAGYYIEESSVEGINYDTAFAQMCLETGFLGYGGLVTLDMNNFCGLGAIGPEEPGLAFTDPRIGVRAHIQHLKAYATVEPLNLSLVDPRYYLVRHGSAPTIHGLSGTWAADTSYSEKIGRILERMYEFAFQGI